MGVCFQSNPGIPLDLKWIEGICINGASIKRQAGSIGGRTNIKGPRQAAWLCKAVSLIDLTTLAGNDTASNVSRLCWKAAQPIRKDIEEKLELNVHVAAVCVYPNRVSDAVSALKLRKADFIPVASVATGFPSGQYSLETRLEEIRFAVNQGAKEIDVVISRSLALHHDWTALYEEICAMKAACGSAKLKTILSTGDLGSCTLIARVSVICMMAGSDFIKTSTGKEEVNAILPVGLIMVRAIRNYWERTGYTVGFKPAGGIKSSRDAILWLSLIKEELGNDWMTSSLFRIGASGVLIDIERQLFHFVTGCYANAEDFAI